MSHLEIGNVEQNYNDMIEPSQESVEHSQESVEHSQESVEHSQESVEQSVAFFVEYHDGYVIRHLIELLKSTNTDGNFIYSPDRISYSQANANNTILNEVVLNHWTPNTGTYIFNSAEPIIVGVTLANLRAITKSIAKKDSVRFYMHVGDPRLYVPIIPGDKSQLKKSKDSIQESHQDMGILLPQSFPIFDYGVDEYTITEPNCIAPVSKFCRMCNALKDIKCSYVLIRGFPQGVIFEGITDGCIIGKIEKFGYCEMVDTPVTLPDVSMLSSVIDTISPEQIRTPFNTSKKPKLLIQATHEICRIRVKIDTIKALGKINNLSGSNGEIRFYMEKELPLKLIFNIGSYGTMTMYLRDAINDLNTDEFSSQ
jgi:hypothetical protein